MVDRANDYSDDAPQPRESPNEPGQIRPRIPHPLFQSRGKVEDADIRFVTFRRRLPDGRIEHCPDEIPAHEIVSWADVTGPWGGGEYQAIAKDQFRREVAWRPRDRDEWILFDFESRPFTPTYGPRRIVLSRPTLEQSAALFRDSNGAIREWRGGTSGPPGWLMDHRRDHPAFRPGTGQRVVWRNQVHVISPSLRCFCCGLYEDHFTGGQCFCGVMNWIETGLRPAAPPANVGPRIDENVGSFVAGADVPSMIVVDYEGARLNELLGGIKKGALLLVAGAAGAGKSTCCAELAAFAARYWSQPERGEDRQPDCKIYWLDSDQKDATLVRECFRVANVEGAFVHRVRLLAERREPYSFDEALRMLPRDARVLVCDSLEKWGANDAERVALLDKLRVHPAWLKIVIAGTNKLGGVSGVGALERADDATVYAERTSDARYTLRFTKRRWQPCASAKARCVGLDATSPDAASPSVESAETDDEAPLPERAAAAHARLLRIWPWKESMRANTIAQALLVPGLEDLGGALHELLGKADDSPLTANEVGNALKIVRDVIVDGRKLTRDLDRKGIARWRLVICDPA